MLRYAAGNLAASISGLDRRLLFLLDEPLGKCDQLLAVLPAAQGKKALHEPKAERRRFISLQCGGLGRHLDATR